MKKVLLFGALALLVAGCESPNDNAGVGSYGYTYDLNLPEMVGSPGALRALETTGPNYTTVVTTPAFQGPSGPPAQSVTFYEGAQPATTAVAGTTPVWTSPTAAAPAPGYVAGQPTVNEAAGAAVGAPAGAAVPGGEVVPQGVPYGGGYYGGGATIVGSNAFPTSVGTNSISISNNNSVIFTNGLTNISGTNVPMTNVTGGITNTNGSFVFTNIGGGPTNFAVSNAAPAAAPVAGATNNLNNLPRAAAAPAGTPPGTQLVPNRTLGEPAGAQISPSPNVPAGSVTPTTTPTQPGPSTSGTTTTTTGTGTSPTPGTQTVVGGAGGVQQNTTTGAVTGPGNTPTTTTPSSSAAQQRTLLNQQRAGAVQQQQSAPSAPAAPAAAPAAPPK